MSEKHEIEVRLFSLALFVAFNYLRLPPKNRTDHFFDEVDHKAEEAIKEAKEHFDAAIGDVS